MLANNSYYFFLFQEHSHIKIYANIQVITPIQKSKGHIGSCLSHSWPDKQGAYWILSQPFMTRQRSCSAKRFSEAVSAPSEKSRLDVLAIVRAERALKGKTGRPEWQWWWAWDGNGNMALLMFIASYRAGIEPRGLFPPWLLLVCYRAKSSEVQPLMINAST